MSARWLVAGGVVVGALGIGLYVLTRATGGAPSSPDDRVDRDDRNDRGVRGDHGRAPVADAASPAAPTATATPTPAPVAATPAADRPRVDGHSLAARREREQLFAKVRDPHAGHEPWDDDGLAILRAAASDSATVADVGCYMAGCIATLTFASDDAYARALASLQGAPAYVAWTGGKQVTAPERRADGSVVVAVLLGRPD